MGSELSGQISKAKLESYGTPPTKAIIYHQCQFGVDIKGLKKIDSVWMDNHSFKDVSGKATFANQKQKK